MRKYPLVFWAAISLAMLFQCDFAFGGSISGRVTRDLDGIGIPGIEVEVLSNGYWVDGTFTDSSGDYVVQGLPAGSYYVRTFGNGFLIDEFYDNIVANSWTTWPPGGAVPVSVAESNETAGINFSLALGGSISGKVSRDSSGAGIQGVEERVDGFLGEIFPGRLSSRLLPGRHLEHS